MNIAADISRMVPPELYKSPSELAAATSVQQSSSSSVLPEVDREKALALFHELSNGLYAVKALLEDMTIPPAMRRTSAAFPAALRSEGAGSFSIGDDDYSSRMSRHSEIGGLVHPGGGPGTPADETASVSSAGAAALERARATGGVGTATGALGNEVINDLREKLRQAQQAANNAAAEANTERSRRWPRRRSCMS